MRKGKTGLIFIVGVVAAIVGAVLFGVGAQASQQLSSQLTSGNYSGLSGTGGIGVVIAGIGGLLIFLSWISGLIRTAIIGRWGWFLFLLILGIIVSPLLILWMLIYLIGAADHRREVQRPMAPA
jgi:drug/metabolite transporter (DMT)-like permease